MGSVIRGAALGDVNVVDDPSPAPLLLHNRVPSSLQMGIRVIFEPWAEGL